jgi:steroid 5-alpha reductase family enzyme
MVYNLSMFFPVNWLQFIAWHLSLYIFIFLLAYRSKNMSYVDVAWSLAPTWSLCLWLFKNVSIDNWQNSLLLIFMLFLAVSLHDIRLVIFLEKRLKQRGVDPRYQEFTHKWTSFSWFQVFFRFYLTQALISLIFTSMLWTLFSSLQSLISQNLLTTKWIILILASTLLSLIFTMIQSYSDHQKFTHSQKLYKLFSLPLWHWVLFPSYFFEILYWSLYTFLYLIFIYLLAKHLSIESSTILSLTAILPTLLIIYLLRYFSGVPLLIEKYNRKFPKDLWWIHCRDSRPWLFPTRHSTKILFKKLLKPH